MFSVFHYAQFKLEYEEFLIDIDFETNETK